MGSNSNSFLPPPLHTDFHFRFTWLKVLNKINSITRFLGHYNMQHIGGEDTKIMQLIHYCRAMQNSASTESGWEINGSTRGNLLLLRSKMPLVLTQNCAENYRPGAKNYEKIGSNMLFSQPAQSKGHSYFTAFRLCELHCHLYTNICIVATDWDRENPDSLHRHV